MVELRSIFNILQVAWNKGYHFTSLKSDSRVENCKNEEYTSLHPYESIDTLINRCVMKKW
jgi:hypothetical protein